MDDDDDEDLMDEYWGIEEDDMGEPLYELTKNKIGRLRHEGHYKYVIGGAGWTAAGAVTKIRDLDPEGKNANFLVVEASRRVGGRTHSVNIPGQDFKMELGSTWVTGFDVCSGMCGGSLCCRHSRNTELLA